MSVLQVNNITDTGGSTLLGRRNAIINGNFDVWQRGTSQTADGYGSADRWELALSGATGSLSQQSFTVGQTDVPNNPKYFLRLSITGADNNVGLIHQVEDVSRFAGQTVTLSFYAKYVTKAPSSITMRLRQFFGTGGSPSVSVENDVTDILSGITTSWKKFIVSYTLPSITGKTLGTNGNDSQSVYFLNPNNETFDLDIAQVQLEAGSVATPFERRSYGEELALCQRYCLVVGGGGSGAADIVADVSPYATTASVGSLKLPTTMRAIPTLTWSGAFIVELSGTANTPVTVISVANGSSNRSVILNINHTAQASFISNKYAYLQANAVDARLTIDAEL